MCGVNPSDLPSPSRLTERQDLFAKTELQNVDDVIGGIRDDVVVDEFCTGDFLHRLQTHRHRTLHFGVGAANNDVELTTLTFIKFDECDAR